MADTKEMKTVSTMRKAASTYYYRNKEKIAQKRRESYLRNREKILTEQKQKYDEKKLTDLKRRHYYKLSEKPPDV